MNERLMRVQGTASVEAVADETILSFSLSAKDWAYEKAVRRLNELLEHLRTDLEAVAVQRTQLKTVRFRVETEYRKEKQNNVFDGYRAIHNLCLRLPMDREFLNRVLGSVARSTACAELRLHFGVKDQTSVRQRAMAGAVATAKRNAETLAHEAGVSLGRLVRIEYGWAEVRLREGHVYELAEASASPDIEAADVVVEDSVTMFWEMN